MRAHIFTVLKRGDGSKIFSHLFSNAQRAIKNCQSDPLKDEEVKRCVGGLERFLIDLRFAVFFLREDYETSFSIPNKHIDKFAIPNDLVDKKRSSEFGKYLKHVFRVHYDEDFKNQFKIFSDVEIARLDEAMVTLQSGAYFSTIIMCVSAVEARLHFLVKKERPRLYEREKLSDATLGKLLYEISSNKKFKFVRDNLPKRYFHFFDFCNKYRIFSAHPKEVSINYQDAVSIFSLSMAILIEQLL